MKVFNGKISRSFILSLMIVMLLVGTVVGSGVKETIEVAFNSINLTVNGNKVDADTILYEGTTYVPLRAAGEMLGKEVGWNGNTNTASINDKQTFNNKEQVKSKIETKEIFVTEEGDKYHKGNCRYLNKSKISIDLNNVKGKYQPCGVCKP